MENRRNSLSVFKICRFCLSRDDTLTSIYDRNSKSKKSLSLPLKILSCLSVEVFPSDRMPTYICNPCLFFMDLFYKYKEICRKADETIMIHLKSGNVLEEMPWPSILTRVYRIGSKMGHVVNTVVDGATVQVTSQDTSDSEDEDNGNIYNVKIDDELGESSKHIKVFTSNEEKGKTKGRKVNQEDLSYEADSDEEERTAGAGKEGGTGCWPCQLCDCTFPLKQLLKLHVKTKHRARTAACEICDQKFFSKHDLIVHQLRHSEDLPFQCVACDERFKRLVHLKKHEKVMHSDLPQLACSKCPATFLSLEELKTHQKRHIGIGRAATYTTSCNLCHRLFADKSRLQRHVEQVHQTNPDFCCEYCPAQFTAISKLTRHVRTHAGTRSYPCKYCSKTFMKSHHYTRHLRVKHRVQQESDRKRAAVRPGASVEQFRCEQCAAAFESQDELIYHSAIHATQNLTCPLCQEKFEDVDAVTAHIKSHVNGMEFMCELCELVFTSKEKLDLHLNAAHAEELELEDSSMEVDGEGEEDDEDDTGINVTEENGEMVVEIKKSGNFMLSEGQAVEEEKEATALFEESEAVPTYTELATVDALPLSEPASAIKTEAGPPAPSTAIGKPPAQVKMEADAPIASPALDVTITKIAPKPADTADGQTAPILRKAEEVKRKVQQISEPPPAKKEKVAKVESSNSGASDKSLRLLEKELQELKRTNTRNEVAKTPAKSMENVRRRPQLHTSTPKTRAVEQRKEMPLALVGKKVLERKVVTKENKEPKETKDTKAAAPAKEDKKEEKKEEVKEKDTPKSVVKNGATEKSQPEENIRRSTRPSKIKDYAKMIRDKSQDSEDDSDDAGDEEYKEVEKTETRAKTRRGSIKPPAGKPAASPAAPAPLAPPAPAPAPARKRGRPRKEQPKEVPAKMKKDDVEEEEEEDKEADKSEVEQPSKKPATSVKKDKPAENDSAETEATDTATASDEANTTPTEQKSSPSSNLLMSPSGQTLKKVPIRALPPGVKPLPLPTHARPMGPGELCEMQIGKKVVKVQKIVMTKAEVEAMAKKGLVEMKDGTMVLKQGIKLPTSDLSSLVPSLGDKGASKESPKIEKAASTQSNTSE